MYETIFLVAFIVWSLPLGYYRSKFRKVVYQTDSWTINFKFLFWKEFKALFVNMYPDNDRYINLRDFYRFYLLVYILLFIGWQVSKA